MCTLSFLAQLLLFWLTCCQSAPFRFDQLWNSFVSQLEDVRLGPAPLTERALYCMMTIGAFTVQLPQIILWCHGSQAPMQVSDLLAQGNGAPAVIEQSLELLLCLAERVIMAATETDAGSSPLPALGLFLKWASQPNIDTSIHARLAIRDRVCMGLLRLARSPATESSECLSPAICNVLHA